MTERADYTRWGHRPVNAEHQAGKIWSGYRSCTHCLDGCTENRTIPFRSLCSLCERRTYNLVDYDHNSSTRALNCEYQFCKFLRLTLPRIEPLRSQRRLDVLHDDLTAIFIFQSVSVYVLHHFVRRLRTDLRTATTLPNTTQFYE